MEYLDGYSTAVRHVIRKVGLYNWKMISPQGCNFQTVVATTSHKDQ